MRASELWEEARAPGDDEPTPTVGERANTTQEEQSRANGCTPSQHNTGKRNKTKKVPPSCHFLATLVGIRKNAHLRQCCYIMGLPSAPFAVIAVLHSRDDNGGGGGETRKLQKSFRTWFLSRHELLFRRASISCAHGFAELRASALQQYPRSPHCKERMQGAHARSAHELVTTMSKLLRLHSRHVRLHMYIYTVDIYIYIYFTQHSETIVEGYDNDVAVAGEHAAIHHVARAFCVRAPVDVDHYWPRPSLLVDVCGGGEEKQSD